MPESLVVYAIQRPSGEILAWGQRFAEMMDAPIHGTVEILDELHRAGVPLYALTNWSAEPFPHAQRSSSQV